MFNLSECPAKRDPELWQWIDAEAKRQEQNIELMSDDAEQRKQADSARMVVELSLIHI